MVAAGLNPGEVEAGDPDPTRQDCRACHDIHMTYTAADWALTTTDPVDFFAFEGVTYDGGEGNLCANCHQPRRGLAEPDADGNIEVTEHFGPHPSGQGGILMGVAGSPDVEGSPGSHATMVEGTCVACHMGEGDSHTFEADVDACQACHSGMESFDDTGLQTEVQGKLDLLEAELVDRGLLDEEEHPVYLILDAEGNPVLDEEGNPMAMAVPAPEAYALWNWIYIAHDDGSLGVHNPAYTRALLDASLEALGLGGE
jgi:hypothetical protein